MRLAIQIRRIYGDSIRKRGGEREKREKKKEKREKEKRKKEESTLGLEVCSRKFFLSLRKEEPQKSKNQYILNHVIYEPHLSVLGLSYYIFSTSNFFKKFMSRVILLFAFFQSFQVKTCIYQNTVLLMYFRC